MTDLAPDVLNRPNGAAGGAPRRMTLAAGLLGLALAGTAQAQHVEIGDAGTSPTTAQATGVTAGLTLTSIGGTISSTTDADFFLITITDPALFSASTVGGSQVDTQLYLFTADGSPVYLNDDANGFTLQSSLPAGSLLGPQVAGTYILGISVSGVDPVNSANQSLFAAPTFSTDVRGPAGNATGTVAGVFDNSSFADFGAYSISLTGAVSAVPEPSAAALFALGAMALGAGWRRRRGAQT